VTEDILTGFEETGGNGVLNGVLTPLFFAGTAPKFFQDINMKDSPLGFLFHWAVGFPYLIKSRNRKKFNILNFICDQINYINCK